MEIPALSFSRAQAAMITEPRHSAARGFEILFVIASSERAAQITTGCVRAPRLPSNELAVRRRGV